MDQKLCLIHGGSRNSISVLVGARAINLPTTPQTFFEQGEKVEGMDAATRRTLRWFRNADLT